MICIHIYVGDDFVAPPEGFALRNRKRGEWKKTTYWRRVSAGGETGFIGQVARRALARLSMYGLAVRRFDFLLGLGGRLFCISSGLRRDGRNGQRGGGLRKGVGGQEEPVNHSDMAGRTLNAACDWVKANGQGFLQTTVSIQ